MRAITGWGLIVFALASLWFYAIGQWWAIPLLALVLAYEHRSLTRKTGRHE